MSEAAPDILTDFLTEAGELLSQLNEQLPALEQTPQDRELLNAVFRGFHTIKGGAGFIGAHAMVELCHCAEDVFNLLRQGERALDARLMDASLQVLDALGIMFHALGAGQTPQGAAPELLNELSALAHAQGDPVAPAPASAIAKGDLTDQDFEALLTAANASGVATGGESLKLGDTAASNAASAPPGGDTITEDEFDALLDQLHGAGVSPGKAASGQVKSAAGALGHDTITEDEFEVLLDRLHGSGKAPGQQTIAQTASAILPAPDAPRAAAEAAPVPVVEPAQSPTAPTPTAVQPDTTVRVDTRRLDDIMNLVGELVLVRNRLASIQQFNADEEVAKTVSSLDGVTTALQGAVMKARMQPVKKLFARFPRVIRDLARTLHKEVELELFGQETDLDKNLVEALADPLVHLLRNAVDHGIEAPAERTAAGKPRAGRIMLGARQEGDRILLVVEDDGRGMGPDVLKRKAVEKGVIPPEAAARMSDREAFDLIFAAGFSTRSEVSEVSGRGVGMDVVKSRISQLNGVVDIQSELGQGSSICIKLPLTLAILPTLMVVVDGRRFALPLSAVEEILDFAPGATYAVDGQEFTMVREKPLPLVWLRRWLGRGASLADAQAAHMVVVQAGSQRVGFVVDHLIGREEVVIKPLGAFLQGLSGVAGATITGDGRLALILDAPGLLRSYARAA